MSHQQPHQFSNGMGAMPNMGGNSSYMGPPSMGTGLTGPLDDLFDLKGESYDPFLNDDDDDDGLDDIDDDNTLTDAEKQKKREERLERNREIARNCRKRKRERVEALAEEVTMLRETNRRLELKLKMCMNKLGKATSGRGNRGKDEEERRLHEVKSMNQMLEQKCSDEDIVQRLQNYTEVYSDFGEERKKLVKVHINQLEQLLLPTQISKMLLWVLKQDDDFYSDDNPDSMWSVLCKELQLDEKQKAELKSQRGQLGMQSSSMKRCLISLNKFEKDIEKNMINRQSHMDKILKIISPKQIVKFLQWVENNQACVHMLDGLWTFNKKRQDEIMQEINKPPAVEN
mmetsp:Transcript_12620/g.24469  ORF Transcript_12620/g.24469 Transcript_12620/m.24469 type:complete len:343 (+) Transcript_12620:595-1623(+)|eukprot:CAMPEP_0171498714 /NCGR_PEP_ID=MMETSP0958-20121227/8008_1 /TAXON_ID=87120 /ORGANISM="Aurantiochytrium limacinum, Strain ATCCMYA-1381" /LENGTH=342 /DNA_ID=CAMNT_0012033153 /DNA_START=324 /DNA_END=1352 /DNA_ORIENTATION=-